VDRGKVSELERSGSLPWVAVSPFPMRKHVGKITPPIADEAKAHDIFACRRKRERRHHVAPRPLQVLLDEVQGAPEVREPAVLSCL
jgi:hypothetical protein